ncbi:MAG TPA: DNA polymerase clamp loader subunit A [Methylomirabilota bacterium]|nr:DNA polymerase clamp loader subunit A [Methylomirabilota bacterium]
MSEDIFRFPNSILSTKEYLEDLSDYPPMFVNKALSQHVDCILHANAMNLHYQQLTPRQQYDYYFHSIRKMKRKYGKWAKKRDNDTIQLIMDYYDYSYSRAIEVIDLLTKDQIRQMEREMDVGGN